MTGVYCIRNLITGEFYIGSAARNITDRWAQHRHELRIGEHGNFRLQAAWRFYGEANFRFTVVEECPPERCLEREQWFIDIFYPEYNIARVAGSRLGLKHSIETRAKLSAMMIGTHRHLGCKHSPESLAKMRRPRLKYWADPTAQARLSAARKGRPGPRHSPATLAFLRTNSKAWFDIHPPLRSPNGRILSFTSTPKA